MPRLIFKCPYLKPDQQRSAAHRENYVRYIATREGAEFVPHSGSDGPATEKQKNLAEKLLRDFPHCRELFEYEDYLASPTCRNASEFITRALEDNFDKISRRENYVGYIARRPRAERTGSHGLFTGADDPLVLTQVAETVANHPGNVWLPIISLRREDAARLGYDNADAWKHLLTSYAPPDQRDTAPASHEQDISGAARTHFPRNQFCRQQAPAENPGEEDRHGPQAGRS